MKKQEIKFLIPLSIKKSIINSKTRENIGKLSKQQKILMYMLIKNKHLKYNQIKILSREYKKVDKELKFLLGGESFNKKTERLIKMLN